MTIGKISKRLVAALSVLFIVVSGCDYSNGNGGPGKSIVVDPEDMGPACAIYTGCFGQHYVGACVMFLDTLGHYDLSKMTYMLAEESFFVDWPLVVSMAKNIDCVLEAGSNCDNVLACLNQGNAVRNCTYLMDHVQSRYCSDENTLSACVETRDEGYPPQTTAEISIRCDDLGMTCMESVSEGDVWAACMEKSDRSVTGVEIECAGSIGKIFIGEGLLRYDCSFEGCACKPGTYINIDEAREQGFCECPVCDDQTYESRCEGNRLLGCSMGNERDVDCSKIGLVCKERIEGGSTGHFCSYSNCDPMYMVETCTDGVIDYCRSDGMTTISCVDLGFPACEEGAGCLE